MSLRQTDTLIIGASISGLASAAALQKQNVNYTILEKEHLIAVPWRNHYDRLHLHTSKRVSALPYKKFGKKIPRYPSKEHVLDYLEQYQKEFHISPVFDTRVITAKKVGNHWITETTNGLFQSKYLIMATGAYSKPKPLNFKGMESFPGKILHSSQYQSGKDFKGQRVLVVGFGNSACEIAIDLYEQAAIPSMAVRSPVNVIPRDILGISVLELSILMRPLRPRLADIISSPLIRLSIGNVTKLGFKKRVYGPLEEIQRTGNVPVLDIGTIQHIRLGHIKIYENIDRIEGKTIHFTNGEKQDFDAIVAGIGYYRDYTDILDVDQNRFEDLRACTKKQKFFGKDGLYFCGYWISPTGQIREISLDAQKIAKDIAKKEGMADNHY